MGELDDYGEVMRIWFEAVSDEVVIYGVRGCRQVVVVGEMVVAGVFVSKLRSQQSNLKNQKE